MPPKAVPYPTRGGTSHAWEANIVSIEKRESPKAVRYSTKVGNARHMP